MVFPGSDQREQQYSCLGDVLAMTSSGVGVPVPDELAEQWSATLSRLAITDDISETTPEVFTNPLALLDMLGLDSNEPQLAATAIGLLNANQASHEAFLLKDHFSSRAAEARYSVDLLRYQSPNILRSNEWLWQQLGLVTIAGTHLDSFRDARQDARELPQFSVTELTLGALTNCIKTTCRIDRTVLKSLASAAHVVGLDKYVATMPLRILRSSVAMPRQKRISTVSE